MPQKLKPGVIPAGLQSKSSPDLPKARWQESSQAHSSALESPQDQKFQHQERDDIYSSDESESDDEAPGPPSSRPLHTSRSQTHLAPPSSALYPPFYNRPPVPLPPSPSLTSLLRPTFSTTTSRPSTPDSSDVDAPSGNGTSTPGTSASANLASITKSARHAPTVPRAAPKVPTYEYYGFAVYAASSAAFLLYIVWAYVPSPVLHQMGIHYYPNRWWALAIPCWLVALVVYIYVALAGYNTRYLTLPLNSLENLVDETAQVAVLDRQTRAIASASRRGSLSAHQFRPDEDVDWAACWSVSTDAVLDVPIGGVCEILYGRADD